MQPKDWIALAALVLSLVSLGVSIATFRFNRRVKLVELRANFMKRASEFAELHHRFKSNHTAFVRLAGSRGDGNTMNFLSGEDFQVLLAEDIDGAYADYESLTKQKGLEAYETRYHRLERVIDRMRTTHERLVEERQKYEAKG